MRELEVVNKETGEILEVEQTEKIVNDYTTTKWVTKKQRLEKKYMNNPDDMNLEEVEFLLETSNSEWAVKQYESFELTTTMNREMEYEKCKSISDPAWSAFTLLKSKYTSMTNTLQFKNNRNIVNNKDIANILEISDSTWRRLRKELIKEKLIKQIEFDKKKLWKVNPLIVGHSMKITPDTYYAFRSDIIKTKSTMARLYWDNILKETYGIDIYNDSKKN